jgi:DNA-binding NarL/FixJ family response regulator
MDLRMPGGDGVTATRDILSAGSAARVLVLTTYETDADILRAVEAGATGYLLKDATPAELANAIRAAARGETVLAPSVAERLVSHVRRPQRESLSAGKPRSWPGSPAVPPTRRSGVSSTSAKRRSRPTCFARSASSVSPIARRR